MSASMIIKSSSLVPFHPERKNGSSFALIELGWPCPLLPRDQLLWNSKYGSLGPITMEDLTWLGGHTATGHPTGLGMIFFPVSLTRSKATQKVHWICMNSSRCCMAFFRIRGIDSHLCCLAAENWTYWTLVQKCWKRKSGFIRIFQNPRAASIRWLHERLSPETFVPAWGSRNTDIICWAP